MLSDDVAAGERGVDDRVKAFLLKAGLYLLGQSSPTGRAVTVPKTHVIGDWSHEAVKVQQQHLLVSDKEPLNGLMKGPVIGLVKTLNSLFH